MFAADANTWVDQAMTFAKEDLVPILGAFLILLLGYIVAKVIAGVVRKILGKTAVDEKFASAIGMTGGKLGNIAGTIVFWVVMVFVLIAFFSQLKLPMVTAPLQDGLSTITEYLPKLGGAIALLFVAFVVATVVKMLLSKLLEKVGLDEKLAKVDEEDVPKTPLSKTISEAVYWLIFLLFLPGVLDALGLGGMLDPVNEMVGEVTGFLPNILGAVLIFGIGYLVARIVQRIISNLLAATGLNTLGEKVGLKDRKLSDLIGLFIFIVILVPILVSALNTLNIESISGPATDMINDIMGALPGIIGGLVVVGIFYFVGRLISGLVSSLLEGVGFDNVLGKLGIAQGGSSEGGKSPSAIAGIVVLFLFVFMGITQALELANLGSVSELAENLLESTFNIIIGVVIFGFGLWLANFIGNTIAHTKSKNADLLAFLAKTAIVIIVAFMALNQTGLATNITDNAFTAVIYGLALAFGIAFGWAGKDTAAKVLDKVEKNLKLK